MELGITEGVCCWIRLGNLSLLHFRPLSGQKSSPQTRFACPVTNLLWIHGRIHGDQPPLLIIDVISLNIVTLYIKGEEGGLYALQNGLHF